MKMHVALVDRVAERMENQSWKRNIRDKGKYIQNVIYIKSYINLPTNSFFYLQIVSQLLKTKFAAS